MAGMEMMHRSNPSTSASWRRPALALAVTHGMCLAFALGPLYVLLQHLFYTDPSREIDYDLKLVLFVMMTLVGVTLFTMVATKLGHRLWIANGEVRIGCLARTIRVYQPHAGLVWSATQSQDSAHMTIVVSDERGREVRKIHEIEWQCSPLDLVRAFQELDGVSHSKRVKD